ncbi:hypothetical protein CTRC46_02625 [Chlamydia trachomatis RC-L2(s)/46]|nr:hypothetical protein CTL2C_466 [Chlamydia trachomatis L2c]AGR94851.1 hypothetical protein CTRC46_02625 [Chlamydia trachomatis RC-L2(s)/46]AGR96730.1 hypothetical protein CTRC943_02610 [Chlamydia trachomatis RC-J/943]AGR98571.1 hypothetical protein CTRC3_02650 [Chlamydia trachomatis RC-L2(s)/3]
MVRDGVFRQSTSFLGSKDSDSYAFQKKNSRVNLSLRSFLGRLFHWKDD